MSAFVNPLFNENTLGEKVKFVMPDPEKGVQELYNEKLELIAIFDETKKTLLRGADIAHVQGYFNNYEFA